MKKFFTILLVLLMISVIDGCKKEDEEQVPPEPANEEVVLQANVKYVADNIWTNSLNSLDTATGTYYFNSSISGQGFAIGDVMVSSIGDGTLRLITNIQINGDQVVFSTTQATMEDLFEEANIDFQQNLSVTDIKSIEYHVEGMILKSDEKSTNYDWEINSVLYDYDNNPQTDFDQIRLEGEFSFDWNFLFQLRISPLVGLKEVKIGFESAEELNLELIAGLAYTTEYSKKLATVHFGTILIPAGPLVIVIIPSLPIYAGVSGYANANISTKIEQSLEFDVGVHYVKENGWSTYANTDKSFDYSPPQLSVNAGAEAYLKPEFITKIYGVAGPYANIKLYGKIEADLLNSPWWTLSAGANMSAGVKAEVFSKVLFDFSIDDLFSYEQILAQAGEADPTTAAFSADVTSGMAPLGVSFTDESTNAPTSWLWDFGDGNTSTEQNPVHMYQNAGNYTVSLIVNNAGGEDSEIKSGYIQVESPGNYILYENFEDEELDPMIDIDITGTFNSDPGIKNRTEFGSSFCYGFGKSTCTANCFDSFVTDMIIDFATETYVTSISFNVMELDEDWGSSGWVYIDGNKIDDTYLGSLPSNDHIPDSSPRTISIDVNDYVSHIRIDVRDITKKSEIFIDDLVIE